MLRVLTGPARAVAGCFSATEARSQALHAGPAPKLPRTPARPEPVALLAPRPKPPRGWPYGDLVPVREAAAYLERCLSAGPEHFVTALAFAPHKAQAAALARYTGQLRRCVQRHGGPRVEACMRRAVAERRSAWPAGALAELLMAAAAVAPQWLSALAEPSDLPQLEASGLPLQPLFEALQGDNILAWAQPILGGTHLPTIVQFLQASARAPWRAHQAAMAGLFPRPVWKLLPLHGSDPALAGWQPAKGDLNPPTRDEAEALVTSFPSGDASPLFVAAMQYAADAASAQAMFDGAVAGMRRLRRPLEALIIGAQMRGLRVVEALAEPMQSTLPFASWVRCLRGLPAEQAGQVAVDRPLESWLDAAETLDLLAWLSQHQRPELEAWREGALMHTGWFDLPREPSDEQAREARHLLAHLACEDWRWGWLSRSLVHDTARRLMPQLRALRDAGLGVRDLPFTAYYARACKMLGVPATEAAAWRPWVEAFTQENVLNASLPFLSTCLGRDADPAAREALIGLPACAQRALGLPVRAGDRPWPKNLPVAALSLVLAALKKVPLPGGAETLRAMEPHWQAIPTSKILDQAEAACVQKVSPWPWLQRAGSPRAKLSDRWGRALTHVKDYTAPPDELADDVRGWVEAALAHSPAPDFERLMEWLVAHPACEHDAGRAIAERAVGRKSWGFDRQLEAMRQPILTYLLSRAITDQRQVARRWPELFDAPELLHILAVAWLPPDGALPDQAPATARALLATFDRAPQPEDADRLEQQLSPHNSSIPPWAREALSQEPNGLTGDAAFAQANRRRALARYLAWCDAAQVPNGRRDAGATLVLQLLRLPDDTLRHTLLRQLLMGLIDSPDPQTRSALKAAQAQAQTPKAMPLAFAVAWLFGTEGQAAAPHVTQLPRSRAVYTHGARQRTLLNGAASAMRGRVTRGFLRAVLGWANVRNLERMLDNASNRQRRADLLQAAREALRSPEALDALRARMAAHETVCATRLALRADRPSRGVEGEPTADRAALGCLQDAFAWLAGLPATQEVAREAVGLCGTEALDAPEAGDRITRMRDALKASRPAGPERWQGALCDLLLLDLQSLRCRSEARAIEARAVDADADSDGEAAPSAAFFAHKAVRTFMHDQVLPLMLELMDNAQLLEELGMRPDEFDQAGAGLSGCLDWAELPHEGLEALRCRPALHFMSSYVSDMGQRWKEDDRKRGLRIARAAAQALASRGLDAWRRQAPQARALLETPGGGDLMACWERGASMDAPPGARWRVRDTGEPDTMLAAVTQVSSCQSVKAGSGNRGMLSRLQDGAKRMVLLEDLEGELVARATARLVHINEAPALLLSRIYEGAVKDPGKTQEAFLTWARHRAQALGVPAYAAWEQAVTPMKSVQVHCAGDDTPDYWDEDNGVKTGAVSFKHRCLRIDGPKD